MSSSKEITSIFKRFCQDEGGQGISEYGALIAFISLLVAITFSTSNGTLMPAVSKAFSAVASNLNGMAAAADSAS